MKITLFTSNNNRHNYLINLISEVADELYVIQECSTIFSGLVPGHYPQSEIMEKYFKKVHFSQSKIFGNTKINNLKENIKVLPMPMGDLKRCSLEFLSDYLKSDIYLVFGSSYIQGELVEFLTKKKTVNIHMGISPFYRGCDCNFWALFDDNPNLVGATIHLLSKGLDSGPILYHAMSNIKTNPFDYTMSTVKSAFVSLLERIKDHTIFKIKPINQDKNKQIRYSKKTEFNDKVVSEFFEKEINLNIKKIDNSLLKDPFFLNN